MFAATTKITTILTIINCYRLRSIVGEAAFFNSGFLLQNNNPDSVRITLYLARSHDHCCRGKAVSTTYSECVTIALLIKHACAELHFHLWPVRIYHIFSHCHKRHDCREKKFIECTMCVLILSANSLSNIFPSKKNSVRYYHIYISFHVTYPLFLSDF